MKVCVIGTGYVGLVTGTGLAEMGNQVVCVDNDEAKIARLKQGHIPIYEPGLEELLTTNLKEDRIRFTTDLDRAVKESQVCMIAVGTPQDEDGSADLSVVFSVARDIAVAMNGYKVIATKSTVPVGTGQNIHAQIAEITHHPFAVVSNPEFLKQGEAVDDFLNPDRVIVGTDDDQAAELMRELYAPFLRTGNPVIFMDRRSAEMTKYAANAFLATKISFINEMANLCEHVGADIEQVRIGIASDQRIGPKFLFPGLGYGGSCLGKDIKALINTAQSYGYNTNLLAEADTINHQQRLRFLDRIVAYYDGDVSQKTFALWGLAFKPRTDDMRYAPSRTLIEGLLARGAKIQAFDPAAIETARAMYGDRIRYMTHAYEALVDADALLLVTEWNEFRRPDYDRMKQLLKAPVVFDGRNQFDYDRMQRRGFIYHRVGRVDDPFTRPVVESDPVPSSASVIPVVMGSEEG
ncbi:MAG: UDP-glucose/GDP-mannose dehydrogenase family protein [Vampirovibrionales bacterium]